MNSDDNIDEAAIGEDSTVDDWFGQDVQRDTDAAEKATELAGGDEKKAEEIFEEIRPEHLADKDSVPADERPGGVD